MTIFAQNVNGLKSKTSKILCDSAGSSFDVFMLTETNLDDSVFDNELFIDDFSVFRNDRNERNNPLRKKSGGGVLIAVNHRFASKVVVVEGYEFLEQICVQMSVGSKKIFLICIYLPPNSNPQNYQSHVEFVEKVCDKMQPEDVVLCYGDYNLPRLVWELDEEENFFFASNASSEAEVILNDGFLSSGLRQISEVKNANGRMLDLVFTNYWEDTSVKKTLPVACSESHHEATSITMENLKSVTRKINKRRFLNFKKSDFEKLNCDLLAVNWGKHLNEDIRFFMRSCHHLFHEELFDWFPCLSEIPIEQNRTDQMLWIFLSIFFSLLIQNTPVSSVKLNSSFPPWFDDDLIQLCRYKNSLHKKLTSDDSSSRKKYEEVRREFKALSSLSFKRYSDETADKIRSNPKEFFEFVNQRKKTKKFPSMMKFGEIQASSDEKLR